MVCGHTYEPPSPPPHHVTELKAVLGEDGLLIALPPCGPLFGWHHRTQMTSQEARGFQQQHLALWQMVRPSGSQLWLPPDVSPASPVCKLPFFYFCREFFTRRHFVPEEPAGSYLRRESFPSGGLFDTKTPESTRPIQMHYQGHLSADLGCWAGGQGLQNKLPVSLPLNHFLP